jgi:hypothetical protein
VASTPREHRDKVAAYPRCTLRSTGTQPAPSSVESFRLWGFVQVCLAGAVGERAQMMNDEIPR